MTEQESPHPVASRLDALAIGEGDDATRDHVASCEACAAYVAALEEGAAEFQSDEAKRADAFVAAVREREARERSRRRFPWTGGVASAIVLAAGVALFVRSRGAPTPHEGPVAHAPPSAEGPMRFKGAMQLAVIVEHAGSQTRQTGPLSLEPGDRIRLEIGTDRDARVEAGVLTEGREWAELEPATVLLAGTHYSEQSITFTEDVPSGWIVVGPPDAVARARQSGALADLVTLPIGPRPKSP